MIHVIFEMDLDHNKQLPMGNVQNLVTDYFCAKNKPYITMSRSCINFSVVGVIWDEPSDSENVYYYQRNLCLGWSLSSFGCCVLQTKDNSTIQTVISIKYPQPTSPQYTQSQHILHIPDTLLIT